MVVCSEGVEEPPRGLTIEVLMGVAPSAELCLDLEGRRRSREEEIEEIRERGDGRRDADGNGKRRGEVRG